MAYDFAFFDLDGTLTDPAPGMINSLRHMEARLGLPALPEEVLRLFIGPPLHESLMARYGIARGAVPEAMAAYREHFSVKGLFENALIPGTVEMLEAAEAAGAKIVLATSKPEVFAVKILEHFGIMRFFAAVQGSPLAAEIHGKERILRQAMERAGFSGGNGARAAMVGDRDVDILAAKALGAGGIAVAWGYAAPGELEAARPLAIVSDMAELTHVLTA